MKKKKKKKSVDSNKKLIIVFFLLLVLVIVLTIMCIIKNKDNKEIYANMVIPVIDNSTNFEFNINALELSKTDEYIFKIVNYRKNNINKDKISYKVEVINNTSSNIEVKINDVDKDLMLDQKSTIFEEMTLSNKKKESIYYHIKIKKNNGLTKDDLIYVKIYN